MSDNSRGGQHDTAEVDLRVRPVRPGTPGRDIPSVRVPAPAPTAVRPQAEPDPVPRPA